MKILFVQDSDWIRRNPILHNHLAERLIRRGHEYRVIDYEILWREEGKRELCSSRQTFTVSRIFPDANHLVIRPGILKIPLLDYASILYTYRREIDRQIREFKPDIIIGDGVLTPNLAFRLAWKHHIRTVYYCIDVNYRLIPFRFLHPLGRVLESQNIKMADVVLSANEAYRDYTIRMGARLERTAVIRAGVDLSRFSPAIDGKRVRAECGFGDADRVLLFVGWLYHFAGLKEAAAELPRVEDKTVKLLIVGDGDAFAELQKLRRDYGLIDRMVMVGRQPYELIPQFIAAADVCLLPFHNNEITRDAVPAKMYEYMAMAKPVVATRLDGIRREFGEGAGVVYIDRPVDAVKTAVRLIAEGKAGELGTKARASVEPLSWDRLTDEFEKTLTQLCPEGNGNRQRHSVFVTNL